MIQTTETKLLKVKAISHNFNLMSWPCTGPKQICFKFGPVQIVLHQSKSFWTWAKKQNLVLKIHFGSSQKLIGPMQNNLDLVQNRFGPIFDINHVFIISNQTQS